MPSPMLPTHAAVQQLAGDIRVILQQAGIPRVSWTMEGKLEQAGYEISSIHWNHVGLWYRSEPQDHDLYRTKIHQIKDILSKHFSGSNVLLDGQWYQLTIDIQSEDGGSSMGVNLIPVTPIPPKPGVTDKIRRIFKLGRSSPR